MQERHAFEREIRALEPSVLHQVPPVGVAAQVTSVGSYAIRSNAGATLPFWSLALSPAAPAAAGHVVFDIDVELSDDPLQPTSIAAPALAQQVTGAPPNRSADLIAAGPRGFSTRRVRFAFAVPPNGGGRFRGKVRMTIPTTGGNVVIDLPISGADGTRVDDLFVYGVVQRSVSQSYGFVQLRIVEASNPTIGARAGVVLAVVRGGAFKSKLRQTTLDTDQDGFAVRVGRKTIAIPTRWPFLVRAGSMAYVKRAHFVRLDAASDNGAPATPPALPFRRRADVNLANKRLLLDAGHGVVYNHEQRRSQEWFAAHKLIDEIIRQLTAIHRMPRQNIVLTRTAGFALIEPANVNRAATEDGAQRPIFSDSAFAFSLARREIRVTNAATRSLRQLSDLLLVEHQGDANTAQPVAANARQRLLTGSPTTVAAIEARLNASLAGSNRRVRPGSIRWDVALDNYVYTREPTAGGTSPVADVNLPITNRDLFTVDDAMLRVLADRSARWSLAREIGSGPAADGSRPSFANAARAAMRANGGIDYMRDKVIEYLAPGSPPEYFTSGIKAWSPSTRIDFINAVHGAAARRCDLYLTVHLNAAGLGAKGTAVLIDDGTPRAAPIRMAKLFMKHVDPLSNGLQRGGIVGGAAGMLNASNTARDSYVYFETEFMTSTTPRDPNRYNYEDMVRDPYLSSTAEQIIAGIIEAFEGVQSDLDTIQLDGRLSSGGVVHW